MECDAFGADFVAMFMQKGQPIAFYSKHLKRMSLLLSTYEKELQALVSSVAKWRPYLLGHAVRVNTNQ